jgi:hypothetical protein
MIYPAPCELEKNVHSDDIGWNVLFCMSVWPFGEYCSTFLPLYWVSVHYCDSGLKSPTISAKMALWSTVWVGLGTGWAMPFHSAANSPWALCSGPVRGTRGSSSKDLMCQCINWPTMRSSFLLWADLDMGYGCSLAFFLEPSLVFTTQSISSAFQLHSTTLPQIFQYNSICYCLGYFLHVWEVGQETPVFYGWEVIIKAQQNENTSYFHWLE